MEAGRQNEVVNQLRAHVDAARRQRQAAMQHPQARDGFLKAAHWYVARAATLAGEICTGAAAEQSQAPVRVCGSTER